MGRPTEANRIQHMSKMPLGLVGEEWEPGGAEFETARASTGRALSKLARVDWPTDQVMDWEVWSWLREQHYGDASMQGLRRAALAAAEGGTHG